MVSFDPNRPDFTPYGFTCVRWSPSPMRRPDHHNEIELNLLQSGWLIYLLGGRKEEIRGFAVCIWLMPVASWDAANTGQFRGPRRPAGISEQVEVGPKGQISRRPRETPSPSPNVCNALKVKSFDKGGLFDFSLNSTRAVVP